jgi:hypothetical protein
LVGKILALFLKMQQLSMPTDSVSANIIHPSHRLLVAVSVSRRSAFTPDGGYAGATTAEEQEVLFSLTTGLYTIRPLAASRLKAIPRNNQ